MRWFRPNVLDVRYRTFFALFPITIENETRWLEVVKVREEYRYSDWLGYHWLRTNFEPLVSVYPIKEASVADWEDVYE